MSHNIGMPQYRMPDFISPSELPAPKKRRKTTKVTKASKATKSNPPPSNKFIETIILRNPFDDAPPSFRMNHMNGPQMRPYMESPYGMQNGQMRMDHMPRFVDPGQYQQMRPMIDPNSAAHNRMAEQMRFEKMKSEHIRNEQMREEHIREEQMREQQMRKGQLREEQMRAEHMREDHIREEHIKEEHMREEHIRNEQMREEQMRQDHMREDHWREDHIREEEMREQQMRVQLIDESLEIEQLRSEQIRKEESKLDQMREQLRNEQLRGVQMRNDHQRAVHQRNEEMKMRSEQMRNEHLRGENIMRNEQRDQISYPPNQPIIFDRQNPNAPPIYPCRVCQKEVDENDQAILCESGCNFWFHRHCHGLTEEAFHLIKVEVFAEWCCDECISTKDIPLVKFRS